MSPITTHVLDVARGKPASGVNIVLEKKENGAFREVGRGATDADGRLKTLLPEGSLARSVYRITFATGAYYAALGEKTFYPEASVVFEVADETQHYHVPLLVSPYGYSTYRGSLDLAHLREILDLVLRWFHLIAGIMWIGNSMLFNWLDRNLIKREDAQEGHEGTIWMVHSGGFYEVEKKQLAPNEMPAVLHWFKWQNGFTWMSGILLLVVVYYMGGGGLLVDKQIADVGVGTAVAIGVGSIVISWALYDALWKSPIGKNSTLGAAICLVYLGGVAYGLTHVLSGRAAYIHVGVILGTIMTGNVWMVILPSQRELIAMTKSGKLQDSVLAKRAKQRSIHNNYMTFPLLFIMISNHFPSTYGSALNWVVLGVVMIAGAGVRHFMNIRFWFANWVPALFGTAFAGLIAIYVLTAPKSRPVSSIPTTPIAFKTVRGVIGQRCNPCHSQAPTDDVWKFAPNGVMLDTPDQIAKMAARIKDRAVISKTMPLGNKTGMTDAERDLIGDWVDQGAKVELPSPPVEPAVTMRPSPAAGKGHRGAATHRGGEGSR